MCQDIVCNFGAIEPAKRDAHAALAEEIFTLALEIRELEDGYGFRLPLENISKVSEWIMNERLCCPFFTFTMIVGEALWLHLTGTAEVKAYIHSIIVEPPQNSGKLPDKDEWIAKHTSI